MFDAHSRVLQNFRLESEDPVDLADNVVEGAREPDLSIVRGATSFNAMRHKHSELAADRCPDDPAETADEYILCRLSPGDTAAFAKHCSICASCAAELRLAESFSETIRVVGRIHSHKFN